MGNSVEGNSSTGKFLYEIYPIMVSPRKSILIKVFLFMMNLIFLNFDLPLNPPPKNRRGRSHQFQKKHSSTPLLFLGEGPGVR